MKKFYSFYNKGREADIYIFGDIMDEKWVEEDVTAISLAEQIKDLDADTINVHINSYGGSVSAGLTIYNVLKNHKATVRTYCDGFACSIASVIFMAGEERIMNEASLLMIHNAWMYTAGNAAQLRKDADDLDIITQASIAAYMSRTNITEDELKALLNEETWLLPSEALEKGFATSIVAEPQTNKAAASARKALFSLVKAGTDEKEISESVDVLLHPANPIVEPNEPQENKTIKFFNALLGGKE